ncbi:disease resistance protein RPS6-like [Hevea brasiliensis]|uniref:disease resistance protein RPS6-like n=1 Tax=Hevea brasiliensis TaxID=3981 RepID=UPI0025DD72C2|nr:disease resistance protein RPS6-like [Hevea brasiliensis]
MHDLIQEMGQNIARRKMARHEVFNGMKKVEGIFSDMSELGKIHLGHGAFPQMHNLRLLKCYRPQNWSENKIIGSTSESSEPSHLLHLSNKLSLLHWDEYPYKSLPSNFLMENLVEINMQGSKVEQLWNGRKCPQQLKRLNLSESVHLRRLPNLSSATELEWISLQGCESLIIHCPMCRRDVEETPADFEVPVVPKEGDCFYFACECRFKIPTRETYDNERSGRPSVSFLLQATLSL